MTSDCAEASPADALVGLRDLPAPPPLDASSEELKGRLRDAEGTLMRLRSGDPFDEVACARLSRELDELQGAIRGKGLSQEQRNKIRGIESILRSGAPIADDNLCKLAQELGDLHLALAAATPKASTDRQLAARREIKEIEKVLKAHKKKSSLECGQFAELTAQLAKLQHELLGVQTSRVQRTVLLSLRLCVHRGEDEATLVTLSMSDRVSLARLSEGQTADLCGHFAPESDGGAASAWDLQRHSGLRTAALQGRDAASLAAEMEHLAIHPPHVIAVRTTSLESRGRLCAVLRNFKGALLVVEDPADSEATSAALLRAVGVQVRWRVAPNSAALQPVEVPKPIQSEVIADLKGRELREDIKVAHLFAAAESLSHSEFGDDLVDVLAEEGVRLGLLVSAASAGSQTDFLGFIVYKFWGPPLKAMSIARVAVPAQYQMQGFGRRLVRWAIEKAKLRPRYECDRVSLHAIPKAISFYERLHFVRAPEEPSAQGGGECSEGSTAEPSGVRMEYHYGRAQRHTGRR